MEKQTILIVGFGWACAGFLKSIDTNLYNIHIVSKSDEFIYTPLLAQNITQNRQLTLKIEDIKSSVTFHKQEVTDIDFKNKKINSIPYDYVIFSHGAVTNTFNIPGVDSHVFFLRTAQDIDKIRNKLKDDHKIAIIGCGLTGSEIIGTLLDTRKYKLIAIDGLPRPLMMFDESLVKKVIKLWYQNNVKMYFNHLVTKIDDQKIYTNDKIIDYDVAIWCGGIKSSPLSSSINKILELQCNKGIPVTPNLQIKKVGDAYAMGDCAVTNYPPTAQVSFQQGTYLAQQFNNSWKNPKPFAFSNKGQIGYIGNNKSIYQSKYFQSSGNLIYYVNKFIHTYYLFSLKK